MKRLLVINATNDKVNSKTYFVFKDVLSKIDITGFEIKELDLVDMNLPILTTEILKYKDNKTIYTDLDKQIEELAIEFCTSDAYIFIFPTWNLSVPAVLKIYIDLIADAGKVFNYTSHGSIGLLDYKKAILINSSGGVSRGGIDYMINICNFMHLSYKEVHVNCTSINYKRKMEMLYDYKIPVDYFLT